MDGDSDNESSLSSASLHTIPVSEFEDFDFDWATDPITFCFLAGAAFLNDVDEVKRLLAKNWNVNNNDHRGNTCVHYAAAANSIEALEVIVGCEDVRVDLQNFRGATPFHACLSNNPEVKTLDILYKSGFPLDFPNVIGSTAVEVYFESERHPISKTLEIIQWISERDVALISRFCLNQIIKTYKDDCLEIFHLLIYHGFDLNRMQFSPFDDLYEHPFITAWIHCKEQVLEFLFDFVDFNAESPDGKTVFSKSMMLRRSSFEDKRNWYMDMITAGADINHPSSLSHSCCANKEIFQYIWKNCDRDRALGSDPKFFLRLLCNGFPVKDYLEVLYQVLGSEEMEIIASNLLYDLSTCDFLVEAFVSLGTKIDQTERAKILFSALTYDNNISFSSLKKYYLAFNFDEGFEAFFKVTVCVDEISDEDCIVKRMCFPRLGFEAAEDEVETLTVLCRNVVRKLLRPQNGQVFFEYYNEVQKLEVPPIIKDIISLKIVM